MTIDKTPQQATGLEKQVLGACLLNAIAVEDLKLTSEMFYLPAHQIIFDAILKCGCDIGTVTQYLRDKGTLEEIGGVIPLTKLTTYVSTNDQVFNHARIIEQKFIARQAWEILQKASGRCQSTDDIVDIIDNVKNDLTNLVPDHQDERQLRVDLTAEPQPAPALLYLRNSVKDKLIPSFTLQNFSLITGKAKSRKTFLTVLLVASYLGYINDIIHADPERKGIVLFIDTEQSPYHLHRMMKRICELIGEDNPPRLQAYGLKTLTPEEKRNFIEYKIRTTPEIVLLIIDGIRDLVYDINSPEEATKTSVLLMKWCASYNIHILNVLHQNKADGNARGHLGSELVNKAETVLSVNLDGDKTISTVDSEYSREMEFDTFSFIVNDNSLPEICGTPEKESETKSKKPQTMNDQKHYQASDSIFKNNKKLSYIELQDAIICEFGNTFGLSVCRTYISYYLKKGWIIKLQDGHKVFYTYTRAAF
jgi:hypothetical protein